MFRCATFSGPLLAAVLLCATPVRSQSFNDTGRKFPATALRGEVVFSGNARVALNGRPAQLAPGARIFDQDNRLLLLGDVTALKAVVHYTTDLYGQPLTLWLLTPSERARKPWPVSFEQAQQWRFDPDLQTWSQP